MEGGGQSTCCRYFLYGRWRLMQLLMDGEASGLQHTAIDCQPVMGKGKQVAKTLSV